MWFVLKQRLDLSIVHINSDSVNTYSTPKSLSALLAVGCTDLSGVSHAKLTARPQGRKWFDCAECHAEQEDHILLQKLDMVCGINDI